MPGNEVGDRIHNFLGAESLSQGQHHSQVIDRTWPGLSNNLWVGSQRQVGGPFVSSSKNFSVHQLETDRGLNGQPSNLQHGLNFTQSGLRPESARSQSQNHSSIVNGYMQGHQAFQARQNETNFLGVDTASRGLSALDAQTGNGPDLHKKYSLRLESTESPVNYDFFGGQQQISGQYPGMFQPLPRQQAEVTDMQLLQQHAMLKQMRELQRQQLPNPQFQLPEARQLGSVKQLSTVVKQGSDSHSLAPITGVPVHGASNYSWKSEHMTSNANWLQGGASPSMQGSSGGFLFSPEQSQVHLMGLVPQQVDRSFYGISNSGARGNPYQYSSVQIDKSLMQRMQASSNSIPDNQYAMFPDQVNLQDGSLAHGQGDQGKNVFGDRAGQGLNDGFHSENLPQMTKQPKNAVMQESCGRQGNPGLSETSLEKSLIQAAPPRAVATLDPTEEKILFGSDDSVWDIFARSSNMGSMLDGTDSFGAFPSLQSGSWSALMQSAVAETSGNDIGVQEEWSGLGLQNSEPPSGNMPPLVVNDGSKQQSAWADNNLPTASSLNSKLFSMSPDANINLDFCGVLGVQQSGVQTANGQTERTHNNSSQRFVNSLTEERSKWVEKLAAESACSPDSQVSAKSISGHQQGMAVYSPHGQPYNKPNSWNFIDSASHSVGTIAKSQDIQRSLQPSRNGDHRSDMHEERGPGSAIDLPVPDTNIESRNVSSALGSPQVNRKCTDLDNVAAITDSRTTRVTNDSSQQLPSNHDLHLWKSVDSKVNSGPSWVPAKYLQNQDKSPETFDSSGNNCVDKGASEVNGLKNANVKETSNDCCSNLPQYTSTGGMRDNVWLDANDLRGGKQKSSTNISHKPFGARKFQYHPMGDLDVEPEPSYGTKSVAHSWATSQHVSQGLKGHDQGYFGQSKFTGHAAGESTEVEKGLFPGLKLEELSSKSSNPGSTPDKSFGGFLPNNTAPMSQNMLELFQKIDQPSKRGTATHLSSSGHNQSTEMPDAETSGGSVGQFQHNRPTTQGFGLQLGPPSQRFTIPDRAISSQSSPQVVNSLNLVHVSSEVGRKGHTRLDATASVQPSTHGASHGDIRSNASSVSGQTSNKASQNTIQGNVSAGFIFNYPYLKSHLQSQHVTSVDSQVARNVSVNAPFGGLASQSKQTDDSSERDQPVQDVKSAPCMSRTAPDNDLASSEASWPSSSNQNHARDPGKQFPVLEAMPASEPSAASESSRRVAFPKNFPNVQTSVSAPQHLLGAQPSWATQNLFNPNHQSNINSGTTQSGTEKLDDQITGGGAGGQSEFPADSAKPQSIIGEKQPAKAPQVLPDNDASQNCATMQKDIEDFGCYLRPNNAVNQKYSLLHQMQGLKNIEIDPSDRNVKKFKGPDSCLDAQLVGSPAVEESSYGSGTMMRDAAVNCPLDPSGNSKILSVSSNTGDNRETHLSSNDMLAVSQHFPDANNSAANLRGEHSQICPQMAPTWFDQYGTFKNGKMLPIYDAQKIAMMKATEKAFIVGRPSDSLHDLHSTEQVNAVADSCQLDNAQQSLNLMPVASDHISPHSLCPDVTNQNSVVVRAKKRRSMTFELLPWHREVTRGSQSPQNISVAEVEWVHATNRLTEKVEDEPEMIEEWPPVLRSKRRLILTTQLMQQLLRAPPRVVLSADVSKNYETVAYSVARSVLGDACSTSYIPESDTAVPLESGSILHEKLKEERNESILKAVEDIIIRGKKVENNLQSLDKRASILDLRVECQDLEKVSVINRFAKFHGRGQADGAETSSSSDAIASSHKFFPQRYVTALPMPRNLPDRVQCLSL